MTDVAVAESKSLVAPGMGGDMLNNPAVFEHLQRVAKVLCASALVPEHLKKNNGADALLALQIARERGENPVLVLQNIYIVSGKAGWSAKYMIARANKSGIFKGPIRWRESGQGDDLEVTAVGILADTGEEVGVTATMKMAKAEGWTRNQKYQTMPAHMLRWRSATMLVNLYCPEVMVGMSTADELEDLRAAGQLRDVTQEGHATTASQVGAILAGASADARSEDGDEIVTTDGEIIESTDQQQVTSADAGQATQKKSWKIADTVVGQDARRKAFFDLLGITETEQEVDDLTAEHQDFIDKLGRLRAETMARIADRKAELGKL